MQNFIYKHTIDLENVKSNKMSFFSFTEPYGDEMTVLYLVEICSSRVQLQTQFHAVWSMDTKVQCPRDEALIIGGG